jgi:hypothetical protein
MIPALILLAIGLGDWLTTALILKHGGGERFPATRWAMAKLGIHPFFALKTAVMAGFGFVAPWWMAAPVAAFVGGWVIENVLVLRRLG